MLNIWNIKRREKMKKVYLIHLEFTDGYETQFETRVALTHEKAKEILRDWAENEIKNSWIGDYEDYEDYQFDDTYFHAQKYEDLSTTIWIEEKEIEE
jgi:predicted membrane protein